MIIVEDSAFPYFYSEFIEVATQGSETDNHVIKVSTEDFSHVAVYNLQAAITLIEWPEVTYDTELFEVVIKACLLINS